MHAGVAVHDLASVARFFNSLGLECGDLMTVAREWVDRIIDLPDAGVEAVMVPRQTGPTRSNR